MPSEAELTLILRAKDLASTEIGKIRDAVGTIGDKFGDVKEKASGFVTHMKDIGKAAKAEFVQGFGNLAQDLFSGRDIGASLTTFAGGFVETGATAAANFGAGLGTKLIAVIGGSALVTSLAGTLATVGASIGGFIAAAIPIGMALLPVLLVAALVAAVIFLINNPKIVQQILGFAGDVIKNIVAGLAALGAKLGEVFQTAFDSVKAIVQGVVDTIVGIVNGITQAVKDALAWLEKLPNSVRGGNVGHDPIGDFLFGKGKAEGGWVGQRGPELIKVGERGPEYVSTAHQSMQNRAPAGYVAVAISEKDIARMVDERLYFTLRRAAPTSGRV